MSGNPLGGRSCKAILLVLLAAAPAALVACSRSGHPVGRVFGEVTCQGQPVREGTVSFFDPVAGHGAQATLEEDGSYEVVTIEKGLRVGTYQVLVLPPEQLVPPPPGSMTDPMMVAKDVPDIPEKYRKRKTSPLQLVVKEGKNRFDIDMQD